MGSHPADMAGGPTVLTEGGGPSDQGSVGGVGDGGEVGVGAEPTAAEVVQDGRAVVEASGEEVT